MIDVKEIRNLYKMFEGDDIDEVEIHSGDSRIRLSIAAGEAVESKDSSENKKSRKETRTAETAAVETQAAAVTSETSAETPAAPSNIIELRSSWVGFFTRLNPKKGENYIKLRDVVKKGSVVGHVRVLGVLQDLVCEEDGKVKEILVEEGQPIEYGQPLMRFEK